MNPFWQYAKRLGRYPVMLAVALALAFISAGSMGLGLIGSEPVLRKILGDQATLQDLARQINATRLVSGAIPDSWIAALPHGAFTGLVVLMCALGLLTILGAAANFAHMYLSLTVVNRTVTALRREAFHRVLRLPLRTVVTAGGRKVAGVSDIISRIINDTAQLQGGFTALISKAVAQVAKGVAALAASLFIEWRVTIGAMAVGLVIAFVIKKLGKRIRRASRAAMASQAVLLRSATEALQALRVVKVHTTERQEAARFHRANKAVMHEMMRVRTARALASPLVDTITIFSLGLLVILAAKLIHDGYITPEKFIVAIAALGVAGASLKPVTGLWNDVQASAGAAERLAELARATPEAGHGSGLARLPRHSRSIEIDAVTLRYSDAGRPALDRVSLTIPFGERIAIVGPNGSGKTTLLGLIPRLFDPDEGAVRIDGHDLRAVSVRSLRRQIGVVTQETVLFAGTIGSNITYGAGNPRPELVRQAVLRARAADFVDHLPLGLDTPVGEQGLTLSGGQRQRIAIARAILRDPSILILDEATSMIDADSEAQISAALEEFSRERTCLIVAHRLSTVMNADRIVVIDQGRIIDAGTHAELLERCEPYRHIARHHLAGTAKALA